MQVQKPAVRIECVQYAHKIHRGKDMSKTKEARQKPIRRTTLLDKTTIDILEEYGDSKSGSKSISSAIRMMARDMKEGKVWKR